MFIQINLSVNKNIVDKNVGGRKQFFSTGWLPHVLDAEQLADAINQGYAIGPQFRDGRRRGQDFLRSGFVALDADGTFALAEALEHPFIQQFALLLYTTASHGIDGKDRFRVVFATETPITSGITYRHILLGLAERFDTDRRIADAARIFYGCKGSGPRILGKTLPAGELKALIKLGKKADQSRRTAQLTTDVTDPNEVEASGTARDSRTFPANAIIRTAKGAFGKIQSFPHHTPIYCLFHEDKNPSAYTVRSRHGSPGIYCSACRKTWWPEGTSAPIYDFYFFDKVVKKLAAEISVTNARRLARSLPASNKEAILINEQYLPVLKIRKGFTLVKSPKGSGKTTALIALVQAARRLGKSVLLIGHRQVLLRDLATKLGLECYLDDEVLGGYQGFARPDYYAISIDSLPRRLYQPRPYDIVIVDECEQVFSHVTARTVKNPHAVMTRLQAYIGDAQCLYLLDADLNQVTLDFVASARKKDPKQPARLFLNTYAADNHICELYAKPADLIVDMVRNARTGKRIFVACNSKRRAKLLAKMLQKDLGAGSRVLLITADEKVDQEVQDFLAQITTKILQYNAVVVSPAIGTGIDITFPDGTQEIDIVYGFFNSGINSHYDIDQQLGRVRNPKEVKVWVCNRVNSFEIELDAVKLDLVQTGDTHPAVKGFDKNGLPLIDMDHPLLTLQAAAYCAQRASQNRLKEYFIRHKKLNGWQIVQRVTEDSVEAKRLQQRINRLKDEVEQEYVGGVMNAKVIDESTWQNYFDRRGSGEAIETSATNEMIKFEIRHFYNQQVTPDLVKLDDHRRFRDCIARFESLHIHNADYLKLLHHQWMLYKSKSAEFASALGDRPLRSLEAILLSSGLVDESGLCGDKILSKADLQGFLAFSDERRVTIERDLDVNLREDRHRDPVKTLNRCLEIVGLRMDCLGKTRRGDIAVYRYTLDPDRLDTIRKIVQRRTSGYRSKLPEVLEPPRLLSRKKPAPDCQPVDLDSLPIPPTIEIQFRERRSVQKSVVPLPAKATEE